MKVKTKNSEALAWLFFKVNLLVAVLVVVIYASHVLSTKGIPGPVAKALGVTTNDGSFRLNWCDTRVKSIDFGGGHRIVQKGYKWYRQAAGASPVELNFLGVEKWFSKYCRVDAHLLENAEANAVAAVIEFIDGKQDLLKSGPQNRFEWRGQVFGSTDMARALQAAKNLN